MQLTTPHHVPTWTPRLYQIAGIDRVVATLRRQLYAGQPGRVMLSAPTGAGKTGMAVEIARLVTSNGGKVFYVVPRADMLPDTLNTIRQVTKDVLLVTSPFSKFPSTLPIVTLITAKTILRRLRRWPTDASPAALIIDEAHLDPLQARTLADAFPGAILIGLSATPERQADDALLRLYREVVQVVTTAELAREGWFVPCSLFASECPDVALLQTADGDFDPLAQELAFNNPRIMGAVAEAVGTLAKRRQVLMFAASRQHCADLVKMLAACGVRADAIDDRTPDRRRKAILAKLTHGATQAVCIFGVPVEQLDIPDVGAIFVIHSARSRRQWLQEVGASRVPTEHRQSLIVVDFGDNWRRLGLPDADVAWDLRAQPADLQVGGHTACATCGRVVAGQVQQCPNCHREIQARRDGQPLDRPQLLLSIANRLHDREQRCTYSRSVPFRPCPPQFRLVARTWFEEEERRVRRGLGLPTFDSPSGYVEHQCEQAIRRLGYGTAIDTAKIK